MHEAVHFVVLQNPIEIPNEILVNLRATPTTANASNPSPLTENFRDTQPLNGRTGLPIQLLHQQCASCNHHFAVCY